MILTPTPERLPEVVAFLDAFLDQTGCDPKSRLALQTVLEEVYVNIATYSGASEVELTVRREGGDVVLSFADNGAAFNPLLQSEPDVHLPVEERSIGGLGILMIRRMTDRQSYCYENGRNTLTLVRRVA